MNISINIVLPIIFPTNSIPKTKTKAQSPSSSIDYAVEDIDRSVEGTSLREGYDHSVANFTIKRVYYSAEGYHSGEGIDHSVKHITL